MTVEKIVTTPTPLGVTDKINEVITELEGITDSTFQGYWEAGETVEVGDVRYLTGRDNTGYVLECVGAGVTGSEQPDVDISDVGSSTGIELNDCDGVLSIEKGGTDATTAEEACANIGALPLSGGTMTGRLRVNVPIDSWNAREIITNVDDTTGILLTGGTSYTNGAVMSLKGIHDVFNESDAGGFFIAATDGSKQYWLKGKNNGSLSWENKELLTETETWYDNNSIVVRKFSSGFMIISGSYSTSINSPKVITYPVPFTYNPFVVACPRSSNSISKADFYIGISDISPTGCIAKGSLEGYDLWFSFIAIGRWK